MNKHMKAFEKMTIEEVEILYGADFVNHYTSASKRSAEMDIDLALETKDYQKAAAIELILNTRQGK